MSTTTPSDILIVETAGAQLRSLSEPDRNSILRALRLISNAPNKAVHGRQITKIAGEDNAYILRAGRYRILLLESDERLIVASIYHANKQLNEVRKLKRKRARNRE